MRILLDTCTFLWIVSGASALSAESRKIFQDTGNEIFLSVVSAWEISVKHALGRLPTLGPPESFVPTQREHHDIDSLPLDEESVLHVARLPQLHKDPFDRMLVCQAIVHGLTIMTPDELILQYPIRCIW
jgi:PIN domain nuclease of toxin-antitoxin system